MLLSVIIVNYNVKYFLEQCLFSVKHALKNIDGEIIVVDNHSSDGSREYFNDKFIDVNFIWKETNEGFAKANNEGLSYATGKYILYLNPDTIIPGDCLERSVAFMRAKSDVIALGVKMLDGSGKFLKESKRAFPSPTTSLYKLSGLAGIFPRSKIFSKYHLGFLDEDLSHEVDVLAGAFMMIPRNILKATGSFDTAFFMYGEDIDLSYRIQAAGFANFYFAETAIIHFKGESTRKGSFNYVRMFYRAMSIFAKKHYAGTKAGLFNILIQIAIVFSGILSATANLLKRIGLKFIDAIIILLSFMSVKLIWNTYVKTNVYYPKNLLRIAFPAFTILFLLASYFSGLYDNGYKQSRLNKATLTSMLIILAFYSLLPDSLRFSRGIVIFGSIIAFVCMSAVRLWLVKWNVIEKSFSKDDIKETVIVGTRSEFDKVCKLLNDSGVYKRILGRISSEEKEDDHTIGSIADINSFLPRYGIKQIIFCEGQLSYKSIIEIMSKLPHGKRISIYNTCSNTLLQSERKNLAGNALTGDVYYGIGLPVNIRKKRLVDLSLAVFFVLTFPFHFILKRNCFLFFRNVADVLLNRKTWVSYGTIDNQLPSLKPGVLTTTGLPASMNTLPEYNLADSDRNYARDFHYLKDVHLVVSNYHLLS